MNSFPLRRADPMFGLVFAGASALAMVACEPAQELPNASAASTGVHEFAGTWNATGSRRSIPLGTARKGSIIDLRGTLLLTGEGRPDVGFRSDVIALVDSETGLVGRSVWTDEHGDEVFSALKGEGTVERNRIEGTILGGSGRYAGATGSYEFSWKFVIESEDGSIEGSAVDFNGRVRVGGSGVGRSGAGVSKP
jgi:hypothetical protein